ncbi:MAG: hypothetical protein ACJ74Z_12805 [Bryobacteraceae bacterium]
MLAKRVLLFLFLAAAQFCLPKPRTQTGKVIVWGIKSNTPEWNRALGVSGARQGCTSSPNGCIHFASELARNYHVKVFLSIGMNAGSPGYAAQYSQLSTSAPYLAEVGVDDFVLLYRRLESTSPGDAASIVQTTIDNIKSINPNLKFGITLYEDEVDSPFVADSKLSRATRAKFDYIHLYPHFRRNGPNLAKYIPAVKKLFPNATIIAGAYAYDRRNYLPCAQKDKTPCSVNEELQLFQKTIAVENGLLRDGTVDWIEFYPGNFGHEAEWKSWENPRICRPGDQEACISTTKQMREIAIRELGGQSPNR